MRPRTSRGALGAVAAVLVIAASAAIASAAMADEPDGIGLSVTVTSAPTPSASPAPSNSNANSGSGGSGTVVTPVDTPSAPSTPRPGEENLGGILYVSGLSFEGRHSANPAATEATLAFTVHNVSDSVVSGIAVFRVETVFGTQLGTRLVHVYRLKPDETRVVQATIHDLGQWGLLHGSVVFTPPPKVEDVSLAPVTREQFFFLIPWFTSVLAVILAAALGIVWVVRYTSAAGAASLPRMVLE